MNSSITFISMLVASSVVFAAPVASPAVKTIKKTVTTVTTTTETTTTTENDLTLDTNSEKSVNQDSISTVKTNDIAKDISTSVAPTAIYLTKAPYEFASKSYFLAPSAGTEFAVDLSTSRINLRFEEEGFKSTSDINYQYGAATIGYALNPQTFVSANLGFGRSESESGSRREFTTKQKGLADPALTVGHRISATVDTTALLALSAKISTGNNKTEDVSNFETKGNIKKGGHSLTPSLTVYKDLTHVTIGAAGSYEINLASESTVTNQDGYSYNTKSRGRNVQTFTAFAEVPQNQFSIGSAIEYTKIESSITKVDSDYEFESGVLSFTTVTGFANIKLDDKTVIVPSLSVGRLGEGLDRGVRSNDIVTASVMAKTTF